MPKYFTNIAKNELQADWVQSPLVHATKPFVSFHDFGKGLGNIIILPCKFFILTITTVIEALICFVSFLYCYCRSFNDLAEQHNTDSREGAVIVLKTLGLLLSSLLYVLMLSIRLMSTFFKILTNNNGYRAISDAAPIQSVPSRDSVSSISTAMRRYGEYIAETGDDIAVICNVLAENNRELKVYDGKLETEYIRVKNSRVLVKGVTHFQQEKDVNSKPRSSRYCELLSVFRELEKTYPEAEFEDWETIEEKRKITLVMVEEAHANFEAHHMKLLDVAEELMTESGINVQRARNIIRKVEERDKNLYMTRK